MRRVPAIGLMALTMLFLCARPAQAQWSFLKWLEELSGPGHFVMNGTELIPYCVGPDGRNTTNIQEARKTKRYLIPFCDKDSRILKDVKFFLGGSYMAGRGTNPLTYPATVTKKEHVTAQAWSGIAGFRVSSVTDIAISAGLTQFSGAKGIKFNKVTIDPSIIVRPLADISSCTRCATIFEMRFGMLMFPQGFTLADFGATGGAPLTGQRETIFHLGFYLTFLY